MKTHSFGILAASFLAASSLPFTGMAADKETKTDAKILSVVKTIDENEILAAKEAEARKVSSGVMAFAKMMDTEHSMNIDELTKLGEKIDAKPMETSKVEKLRAKGAKEIEMLKPLDGDQFGKAYIDAMVKGHAEALATIDDDLMKKAEHAEVKKFLTDTRGHVAHHLEEAKKLQASMAAK